MHKAYMDIPFGLSSEELILDPAAVGDYHKTELEWLQREASPEELIRILTATVCLVHTGAGTIGECLSTAIIWERG